MIFFLMYNILVFTWFTYKISIFFPLILGGILFYFLFIKFYSITFLCLSFFFIIILLNKILVARNKVIKYNRVYECVSRSDIYIHIYLSTIKFSLWLVFT